MYQYDWQQGHKKIETKKSDAQGMVRFEYAGGRNSASFFVLARHGDDPAIDPQFVAFNQRQQEAATASSLVYTDRSIYRPLQRVFWKVVAYEGKSSEGKFHTRPQTPVTMWLVDPNGERVETKTATTNGFGSAAGEFTIPAGRVLGAWRLDSSLGGNAGLRVEEYKRPTFEARFLDPKTVLRLNRPATLTGEVKYYFGLPVVNGAVKWRVTREPVYPWWFWWWRPQSAASAQTIASGTAKLAEDGTFNLTFTPAADEKAGTKPKGVSYRYAVVADVTDEGGETRSASRAFRLGLVAVEAVIQSDLGFLRDGVAGELAVRRSDLDGVGRAGTGSWRLVHLQQPATAQLPADRPAANPMHAESEPEESDGGEGTERAPMFQTPGDRLRPRWERAEAPERVMHDWFDGTEVARGKVEHDAKGEAVVRLPNLAAGTYRLHYETLDDFSARFETARELIVASERTPLALPAALVAESATVSVGGTARILVHSGLANQPMLLDIYRGGKLVERRRLMSGKSPELLELPIGPADRGGFGVTLTAVRDHQLLQ
ncbi:MAG: MG2 domain-containing protein, partial [Thermoanaerobaculia bacterium]